VGSSGVVAKSIAVVAVVASAGGGAVAVSEQRSSKPAAPPLSVPVSAPKGAVSVSPVPGAAGPAGTKTIGRKAAANPGALKGRTNGVAHKTAKGAAGKGAATSAAAKQAAQAKRDAAAKANGATSSKAGTGPANGQAHRTTNGKSATQPKRVVKVPAKTTSHVPAVTRRPKVRPVVPPARGKAVSPVTTTDQSAPTLPAKGTGTGSASGPLGP
jgi:hypothetical protein